MMIYISLLMYMQLYYKDINMCAIYCANGIGKWLRS